MKARIAIKQIVLIAAIILLSTACKGVGIFSTLAVSEKVIEGSLPDGVSANEGVLFCESAGSDWAYFSAGPSLWAKDITDGTSSWRKVPLPTGYTNIQSIAASANNIVFSAVGKVAGDRTTTVFSFAPSLTADPTPSYTTNDSWTWIADTTYYSASVFYPGSGATFYVNRLTYSGEFADDDAVLSASTLFTTTGGGSMTSVGALDSSVDAASGFWFVTGAATNGTTRLSLMSEDTESGILIDQNRNAQTLTFTDADDATLPFTGITWLEDAGAFAMGTCLTGRSNIGNIFVSTNGNTWWTVGGIDDDDMFISFFDSSPIDASNLVLAGRDIQGEDEGYEHIDVSGTLDNVDDDGVWSVSSADFSDSSSYTSTDLDEVSVTGFTMIGNAYTGSVDTLYVSTRNAGIYSIDASSTGNEWKEE